MPAVPGRGVLGEMFFLKHLSYRHSPQGLARLAESSALSPPLCHQGLRLGRTRRGEDAGPAPERGRSVASTQERGAYLAALPHPPKGEKGGGPAGEPRGLLRGRQRRRGPGPRFLQQGAAAVPTGQRLDQRGSEGWEHPEAAPRLASLCGAQSPRHRASAEALPPSGAPVLWAPLA